MNTYFVEKKYTVTERYRIKAEYEEDAKVVAKSNDLQPYESVRGPDRITAAWPLAASAINLKA